MVLPPRPLHRRVAGAPGRRCSVPAHRVSSKEAIQAIHTGIVRASEVTRKRWRHAHAMPHCESVASLQRYPPRPCKLKVVFAPRPPRRIMSPATPRTTSRTWVARARRRMWFSVFEKSIRDNGCNDERVRLHGRAMRHHLMQADIATSHTEHGEHITHGADQGGARVIM